MVIDKRSAESVYIELNGRTYFIDDSTGEQIVNHWETGTIGESFLKVINGEAVLIPVEPERGYVDEFVSYADFLGITTEGTR